MALASLAGLACEKPATEDILVQRCLEALRVHEPELDGVEVLATEQPSPGDQRLRFEAKLGAASLRVEDEIRCRFESGDRWTLRGIALGGRTLSEGEVALVNSELLLRDLSEHPERLEQTVLAGEPSEPPALPGGEGAEVDPAPGEAP